MGGGGFGNFGAVSGSWFYGSISSRGISEDDLAGGLWKETAGTRGSSRSMVVMSSIPHGYEGIFGMCTFSDIGQRKQKRRERSPVGGVKKICSVPRI
jgi:hypothetical protein